MKKLAFVTGSTRGIGLGILKALAQNGYQVVMSGTGDSQKAAPILSQLATEDITADYIRCDISDPTSRLEALAQLKTNRIDLLVNNAGIAPKIRQNILQTTESSVDDLFNTNLKGTFFMCQLFANEMLRQQTQNIPDYTPRIINISSISAYTSSPNRGEYCISKAGISMVTALFADELSQHNIPVFEIRPGIIQTDMTAAVQEKYNHFIHTENGLPTKRWGLPEDIGKAVVALASGAFDYSTGQIINVDGGFHLRRI